MAARKYVRVNIHQAGRDVEAGHVHRLVCLRRRNFRRHRRNPALRDGHVVHGVQVILRIDDMAALQQQIVRDLRKRYRGDEQKT